MSQTKIQKIATEPPQKPAQIIMVDIDEFEVVTQANIGTILEDIDSGNREPINHVWLSYNKYLDLAAWMKSIENYIKASEAYFKKVEDDYKEVTSNEN